MPKSSAVIQPNLGLVFDRPTLALSPRALSDGLNFRIKNGKLSNHNLGWQYFVDEDLRLGTLLGPGAGTFSADPITLIYNHFNRLGSQFLIFGTPKDLYLYDESDQEVDYLTPRYSTGTVDVSSANPAVVTDASGSPTWQDNLVKAGDFIHFGSATQTDPHALWYEIDSVDAEDQLTLTTAVTGAPLSGTAYTIRKLFTADIDHPWSATTFLHTATGDQDLFLAVNGSDQIATWDGSGVPPQVTMQGGLNIDTANGLTVYRNMLIVFAFTDGGEFFPASFRNSHVGDPLAFSSGLSEEFLIHSDRDELTRAEQLGDSLVFLSERHLIVADFVGDPEVFVFRTAAVGNGPIAGRLVANFGNSISFLGPDTGYEFDGVTVREAGSQVFRQVLATRSPSRIARGFAHFDEENGDLIWAVPLTTDSGDQPEVAYVEHYLEEQGNQQIGRFRPISRRQFPFTAAGFFVRADTLTFDEISEAWEELHFRWTDVFFQAAFPFLLCGDEDGFIYTVNTAQTANGVALPSYVQFGRRPTVDGRMRGLLTRVWPFATQTADSTLDVTLRRVDSAVGNVQESAVEVLDLNLPEDGFFVSFWRAQRYFELRFGNSTGTPWELHGYDLEIRGGGMR
jgi:hypothetical protein